MHKRGRESLFLLPQCAAGHRTAAAATTAASLLRLKFLSEQREEKEEKTHTIQLNEKIEKTRGKTKPPKRKKEINKVVFTRTCASIPLSLL
jgi:hypothetical protein